MTILDQFTTKDQRTFFLIEKNSNFFTIQTAKFVYQRCFSWKDAITKFMHIKRIIREEAL